MHERTVDRHVASRHAAIGRCGRKQGQRATARTQLVRDAGEERHGYIVGERVRQGVRQHDADRA